MVVLFVFMLPVLVVWIGANYLTAIQTFTVAVASAFVGVVLECWLFFAEARHEVNLYHGTKQC